MNKFLAAFRFAFFCVAFLAAIVWLWGDAPVKETVLYVISPLEETVLYVISPPVTPGVTQEEKEVEIGPITIKASVEFNTWKLIGNPFYK